MVLPGVTTRKTLANIERNALLKYRKKSIFHPIKGGISPRILQYPCLCFLQVKCRITYAMLHFWRMHFWLAIACASRKYHSTMNAKESPVSVPSLATRKAVAALLSADNGLSAKHRARVLAVLDAPDGIPEREAGWLPATIAAARLGVNLSTLVRWIDAGKVHCRKTAGERSTLVSWGEVSKFATDHPRKGRGIPSDAE